jgi:hypothetical protein
MPGSLGPFGLSNQAQPRDCQVPRHPLQNVTGHPLHFCGQQFGIQMEVSVGFVGAAGYQQPQSGLWGSGNRFSVSTSP